MPQTNRIPQSATAPTRLSILGATGSIGTTAFTLLDRSPDKFELQAITAMNNVEKLAALAKKYGAKLAVIGNEEHYETLKIALAGSGIEAAAGEVALVDAASYPADTVLCAIVGAAGLKPTLAAIRQGARIALANKECLVCAGDVMLDEIKRHGAMLLPVDSEHNAIFQVFNHEKPESVESLILTASGGPFRTFSLEQMQSVTREQALKHPNWSMGAKITIDSATMMNKGLEFIEAYYLFPVEAKQIEIIVHPESIIHSMVRYRDGSVLAQMGPPDMAIPIAYALSWPERMPTPAQKLDFAAIGQLNFEPVDLQRFPCIRLAQLALEAGKGAPIVLNAANEIAVAGFLEGRIGFMQIAELVERSIDSLPRQRVTSLDEVLAMDADARQLTTELMNTYAR